MIISLNWDSDLFGYPVGRFDADGQEWFSENESKDFELLYIFSKKTVDKSDHVLQLADIKTVFTRQLSVVLNADFSLIDTDINTADYPALLLLAFESGLWSRFKTDKNFRRNEFEKLYETWIERSISKQIADEVIVYRQKNDPEVKGFITVKFMDERAQIGLIAVAADQRGKGIGSVLIQYACNLALVKGLKEMEVTTQYFNRPAMDLYKKQGFEISDQTYIYHWWRHLQNISADGTI